ncbi:hypothetical protein JAO73_10420 [Hymenobacter sp. BT523]|uniref:hypothetical protein n=1 Tax=Hymenobacter sp. BT523 TaxID=2795725 RepID=UPI0018EDB8E3|nr:hypothetical protein [Hymenobacter sp. BT523]MBJ6109429.1 hypothetical protein [Hymenobacter sp. BT523]
MLQRIVKPVALKIAQLADGHPVRVLEWNQTTDKMKVKSLRTGLTFSKNPLEVFELDKPAA